VTMSIEQEAGAGQRLELGKEAIGHFGFSTESGLCPILTIFEARQSRVGMILSTEDKGACHTRKNCDTPVARGLSNRHQIAQRFLLHVNAASESNWRKEIIDEVNVRFEELGAEDVDDGPGREFEDLLVDLPFLSGIGDVPELAGGLELLPLPANVLSELFTSRDEAES